MIRDVDVLAREWADPDVLADHELAALLGPWERVVVLGDSVAEGTRGPAPGYRDLSWADRLALALPPTAEYTNLGRRGLVAERIRDTQLDAALARRPDLAFVAAGANDVLLGRSLEAAMVVAAEIVDALHGAGARVVTMDLVDNPRLPISLGPLAEATRALGAWHVPLRKGPTGRATDVIADDDLHLNARGHALVATDIARHVARLRH